MRESGTMNANPKTETLEMQEGIAMCRSRGRDLQSEITSHLTSKSSFLQTFLALFHWGSFHVRKANVQIPCEYLSQSFDILCLELD